MKKILNSFLLPTPQATRRLERLIVAAGVLFAIGYVSIVVGPRAYQLSQAKYERLDNGNIVRTTPDGDQKVWSR